MATFVLLTVGPVAGCGGSEPSEVDTEISFGEPRQAPHDEPCQWLSVSEAAEAMDEAGVEIGPSGVATVTNGGRLGDEGADCWYLPKPDATGHLVVTLMSTQEIAENWRRRMEDLAARVVERRTKNASRPSPRWRVRRRC